MTRRDLLKSIMAMVVTTAIPTPAAKPIQANDLIAIGADGKVELYCLVEKVEKDTIHFHVINGRWQGSIKNDMVYIKATKDHRPGSIVWTGNIPDDVDYNDAIQLIREQLT